MSGELIRAIKSIDINKLNKEDKAELLGLFKSSNDPAICNTIALIFYDLNYIVAIPYIIKKIEQKEFLNNNGTLVFALSEMDVQDYFIEFIKMICIQGYEARIGAFTIVEKYVGSISNTVRKKCLVGLEEAESNQEEIEDDKYENSTLHFIHATRKLLERSLQRSESPVAGNKKS